MTEQPDWMTSHESDVPSNPAEALFKVLRKLVAENGESSVETSWPRVLGAENGTADFIAKHSEVVGLIDAVQTFVASSARLESFYSEHVPIWHRAIVFREHWGAVRGEELMALADLKLLATVGDEMNRASSSPRKWDNTTRSMLNQIVSSWESVASDESLPELVRADLRSRLDQLSWLIDSVGLVGVDRVVRETATLIEPGSQAMARGGPSVAKRAGIAIAATVLLLGQADEATQHISGIIEGAETIVQQVGNFASQQPQQLDPAPPKQLESGQADESQASDGTES